MGTSTGQASTALEPGNVWAADAADAVRTDTKASNAPSPAAQTRVDRQRTGGTVGRCGRDVRDMKGPAVSMAVAGGGRGP